MDYFLISLSIIFLILGFLGGILPVIPGPPLSYIGLLLFHFTERYQFSNRFLIIWAVITVLVFVIDYLIPAWGTKKFGGSSRGIWGSMIGLLVGLIFLGPIGIIIGPFAGAVIGELSLGKTRSAAFRAGFGSFAGLMAGTVLKLIVSGMMLWYVIRDLINL